MPDHEPATETTGSISSAQRSDGEWRQEVETWEERYAKNPADAEAAYRYAQALRAIGQRAQAAAVLEQATIHNPDNTMLLGAYGRALADNGAFSRRSKCSTARTRPTSPTGASCRCKARCSIRWAVTTTRSAITRPR